MERLDVYDKNHQKTGKTILRGEGIVPDEEFLQVVHLCIFNSRGQMLIQQRQFTKKQYGGRWDVSAGGFVISGEDAVTGVVREAKEELGLLFEPDMLTHLATIPFSYVFDDFFAVKLDLDPKLLHLQKEELADAKWASKEEILDSIDHESFVDYDKKLINWVFECLNGGKSNA